MRESELLSRITTTRINAALVPASAGCGSASSTSFGLLAAGETREETLAEYPYLEAYDIAASLLYAVRQLDHPALAT